MAEDFVLEISELSEQYFNKTYLQRKIILYSNKQTSKYATVLECSLRTPAALYMPVAGFALAIKISWHSRGNVGLPVRQVAQSLCTYSSTELAVILDTNAEQAFDEDVVVWQYQQYCH